MTPAEQTILGYVLGESLKRNVWPELRRSMPHLLIFPTVEAQLIAFGFDQMVRDGERPTYRNCQAYFGSVPWQQAQESAGLSLQVLRAGGMVGRDVAAQLKIAGKWDRDEQVDEADTLLAAIGGPSALQVLMRNHGKAPEVDTALRSLLHTYQRWLAAESMRRGLSFLDQNPDRPASEALQQVAKASQDTSDGHTANLTAFLPQLGPEGARGEICALWGVDALDHHYPLCRGSVNTISANTGGGKSVLATQASVTTACHAVYGRPSSVLYLSLEMTGPQMLGRAVKTHIDKLETPEEIEQSGIGNIQVRVPPKGNRNYTIDDAARDIEAEHGASGGALRMVVVDHIGLLDPVGHGRNDNERTELKAITRTLKRLALALDICIVMVVQQNRNGRGEIRDSKTGTVRSIPEPRLADLAGSSSIENDSDLVLFLWDPSPVEHGGPKSLNFKIGKYRWQRGPRMLPAWFHPDQLRFVCERMVGA